MLVVNLMLTVNLGTVNVTSSVIGLTFNLALNTITITFTLSFNLNNRRTTTHFLHGVRSGVSGRHARTGTGSTLAPGSSARSGISSSIHRGAPDTPAASTAGLHASAISAAGLNASPMSAASIKAAEAPKVRASGSLLPNDNLVSGAGGWIFVAMWFYVGGSDLNYLFL